MSSILGAGWCVGMQASRSFALSPNPPGYMQVRLLRSRSRSGKSHACPPPAHGMVAYGCLARLVTALP